MAITTAPNAANSTKPMAPTHAAWTGPRPTGAPKMTTGSTNTGRASSPPMPRNEKAVSPLTDSVASMPAVPSIRNWTAAPAAAPPGTMREMALPASWAVITANQALVRRAIRWRENVQAKWAPSATTAGMNHSKFSWTRRGHEWSTDEDAGGHQVEDHTGQGDPDRPLDQCLPPDRPVLLLLELGLERPGVGVVGRTRPVAVMSVTVPLRPSVTFARTLSLRPGP